MSLLRGLSERKNRKRRRCGLLKTRRFVFSETKVTFSLSSFAVDNSRKESEFGREESKT